MYCLSDLLKTIFGCETLILTDCCANLLCSVLIDYLVKTIDANKVKNFKDLTYFPIKNVCFYILFYSNSACLTKRLALSQVEMSNMVQFLVTPISIVAKLHGRF